MSSWITTTAKLSVSQVITWGILYYSFAVTLPFMRKDLGWSEAHLSLGFSVALLVSGLSAPRVGRFLDIHGSRWLMVAGVLCGALGLALWSMATTQAAYLSSWVLIGLAMSTTLYEPVFATVVHAHPKESKRSIVIITLAGALASTISMPVAGILFDSFGWRPGLLMLAAFLVGAAGPLFASLPSERPKPKERSKSQPDAGPAPSSFVVLGVVFMVASVVAVTMNTYAIAFMVAQGQTATAAASIVGLAGVAKLAGRVATSASEWFSARSLLRFTLFFQGLGLLLPLLFQGSTPSLVAMVLIFGATSGARTILRPLLVLEIWGAEKFGSSNGRLQLITVFAKAAAPVAAGAGVAAVGYGWTWAALGLVAATSGAVLFSLPKPETLG